MSLTYTQKRNLLALNAGVEADENGVVWIAEASVVPTEGRADMIGLFVEGGVLKTIDESDAVEIVAYEV